jgi:TonB family protein
MASTNNRFSFAQDAFGVTPDPRFLFLSSTHREAIESLDYGIERRRGFFVLLGQPGTGKTTLLYRLMEKYRNVAETGFIFQTQSTSHELLRHIADDMGIHPSNDPVEIATRVRDLLLETHRRHKTTVLVVDEAQNLTAEALETIRLLSNYETANTKLLQIILCGQEQLAGRLLAPQLVQLLQRVAVTRRLQALGQQEVSEYIRYRLSVAGASASVFADSAIDAITSRSQGIPRNINKLCFTALSLAEALGLDRIVAETIARAENDGYAELRAAASSSDTAKTVSVPSAESSRLRFVPLSRQQVAPSATLQSTAGAAALQYEPPMLKAAVSPLSQARDVAQAKIIRIAESDRAKIPVRERETVGVEPQGKSTPSPAAVPEPQVDPAEKRSVLARMANVPTDLPAKHEQCTDLQPTHGRSRPSVESIPLKHSRTVSVDRTSVSLLANWNETPDRMWVLAGLATALLFGAALSFGMHFSRTDAPPKGRDLVSSGSASVGEHTAPASQRNIPTREGEASRGGPRLQPQSEKLTTTLKENARDSYRRRASKPESPSRSSDPAAERRPSQAGTSTVPAAPPTVPAAPAQREPLEASSNFFRSSAPTYPTGPSPAVSVDDKSDLASSRADQLPAPTSQALLRNRTEAVGESRGPMLIKRVEPAYPRTAREHRLAGTVFLVVEIADDGTVSNVHALQGPELLANAAVKAVQQWRYSPALVDGKPQKSSSTVTVSFNVN